MPLPQPMTQQEARAELEENEQWKAMLADRILGPIEFLDPKNQGQWKETTTLEDEVLGLVEFLNLYISRRILKYHLKLERDGRILPKRSQVPPPSSGQDKGMVSKGVDMQS